MISRIKQFVRYRRRNISAFFRFHANNATNPTSDLFLLFHGIDYQGNQKFNLRFTALDDFVFIIKHLRSYYDLQPLSNLYMSPISRPRLFVTFDDGYKNWQTHLLPRITDEKIPVTLFISRPEGEMLWTDQYDIYRTSTTDSLSIGDSIFHWREGFYYSPEFGELNAFLKRSDSKIISEFQSNAKVNQEVLERTKLYWSLLTDDDIKEMSQSKYVEIGSHGLLHSSLNYLDSKDLKYELQHSKLQLEELTQKEIKAISFPSGGYNQMVKDMARKVGYSVMLAEELLNPVEDTNDPHLFPRFGVYSWGNRYLQVCNIMKYVS